MKTTYERGIEQGIVQGERQVALRQMEVKFGPLPPEVREQVATLSLGALARLEIDLLKAQSLEELHLGG
jgi:Domain of unknown function (DUF4351)